MKPETKILSFPTTPEVEAAARRIVDKVGATYFAFNLPLQIFSDENDIKPNIRTILNYMPRKDRCNTLWAGDIFQASYTPSDIKDFCTVTAAVLRNLARLFEEFGEGKRDNIVYPDAK